MQFGRLKVSQVNQETSQKPLIVTETVPLEPGDHERYSHYVRKDKVVESAVMGTPVVALCGKVWIPNRDPEKFPVCPECKEIYEGMKANESGDSSEG
jgi:hypothetical protein